MYVYSQGLVGCGEWSLLYGGGFWSSLNRQIADGSLNGFWLACACGGCLKFRDNHRGVTFITDRFRDMLRTPIESINSRKAADAFRGVLFFFFRF